MRRQGCGLFFVIWPLVVWVAIVALGSRAALWFFAFYGVFAFAALGMASISRGMRLLDDQENRS